MQVQFNQDLNESQDKDASNKLKQIKELADRVYQLNVLAQQAEKNFSKEKARLLEIMKDAEVDKIQGDEATCSVTIKHSVSFPKEAATKKEVFNYIENKYGSDVLFEMLTINAASFSSFFTKEAEAYAIEALEKGKDDINFSIGEVKPFERYSLSIRKRVSRAKK